MDNAYKKSWRRFLPTRRRLIQLYAALLYNAYAKGFLRGDIFTGVTKGICVPGMNCYSCPGAVGACPLGTLQNALGATGHRAPWYALGILMLYGVLLGRTICGWLCPFGLVQELLYKIPTPKLPKSRFTRGLSYLKYVLLAVLVILLPLYYGARELAVPAFCKTICPVGTLEGAVGLMSNPNNGEKLSLLGQLFTGKFVLLMLIAAACVFLYRAFCRFLCPLGAIYGLFSRVALLGVRVDRDRCVGCGKCVAHCGMDVRRVGDHECIHCGGCRDVCPTGAIRFHLGRWTPADDAAAPAGPKKRGRLKSMIAWGLALALLAGTVWYVNFAAEDSAAQAGSAGYEVGMEAPDFTLPLLGGEGGTFALSECRGQTVVLNFWATWCSACVKELEYFEQLSADYGDGVRVIAIHHSLQDVDVEDYVAGHGISLDVGIDEDGSVIAAYGGSTQLPMTVVIDPEGVILYNQVGAVTYETLQSLVDGASQEAAAPAPTETAKTGVSIGGTKGISIGGIGSGASTGSVCTIRVLDTNGDPVVGATLQICKEGICSTANTDAAGTVTYPNNGCELEVHILRVPEGYENISDTYLLPPEGGELEFVVPLAGASE